MMFKLLKTVISPAKPPQSDAMPEEDENRDRLTRAEVARLFAVELGYRNRRMNTI